MGKKFPGRRYAAPLLAIGLAGATLAGCKSGAEAPQSCAQSVDLSKFGTYRLVFFTQLGEYTDPRNPNYRKDWDQQKQSVANTLATQKPPAGVHFVMNLRGITGNAARAVQAANQLAPAASHELGYSLGGAPRPDGGGVNNAVEISIDPVAPACESSTALGAANSYLGSTALTSFHASIYLASAAQASTAGF